MDHNRLSSSLSREPCNNGNFSVTILVQNFLWNCTHRELRMMLSDVFFFLFLLHIFYAVQQLFSLRDDRHALRCQNSSECDWLKIFQFCFCEKNKNALKKVSSLERKLVQVLGTIETRNSSFLCVSARDSVVHSHVDDHISVFNADPPDYLHQHYYFH